MVTEMLDNITGDPEVLTLRDIDVIGEPPTFWTVNPLTSVSPGIRLFAPTLTNS
jgi:hypothetical protein